MKKGLMFLVTILSLNTVSTCNCMMRRAPNLIFRVFSTNVKEIPRRWYPLQCSLYEEINTNLQHLCGELKKEKLELFFKSPETQENLKYLFLSQDLIIDYRGNSTPHQFEVVFKEHRSKLSSMFNPQELKKLTQESSFVREASVRFLLAIEELREEKGERIALEFSQKALNNLYRPWFQWKNSDELCKEFE